MPWVPEYLREYADEKAAEAGSIWDIVWTAADFDAVADGQAALEAEAVAVGPGTGTTWSCATTTSSPSPSGTSATSATRAPAIAARAVPPALYVLTTPDGVPFVQDGLRDGEHVRGPMTDWFRAALAAQPAPWIEAVSDRQARVDQVVAWLSAHDR